MNATQNPPATEPQRAIFFDGPFSKQDPKGERDEQPYWTVYVGFDFCNPVRTVYQVGSFKRAESLAQAMSHDRKLELVAEAMPA
jgi:hypothetical protein